MTAPGKSTPQSATATAAAAPNDSGLREEIATRAHALYCERGCVDGFDVEHWLEAETDVLARRRARQQVQGEEP